MFCHRHMFEVQTKSNIITIIDDHNILFCYNILNAKILGV